MQPKFMQGSKLWQRRRKGHYIKGQLGHRGRNKTSQRIANRLARREAKREARDA